MISNLVDHRF